LRQCSNPKHVEKHWVVSLDPGRENLLGSKLLRIYLVVKRGCRHQPVTPWASGILPAGPPNPHRPGWNWNWNWKPPPLQTAPVHT